MKLNKLRPVSFLPLLFIVALYGCYSVRTFKQTENLDRMFEILFSGEQLDTADRFKMKSYSRDDLLRHMETWGKGKQKAAFLILQYNNLEYKGLVSRDTDMDTNAEGILSDNNQRNRDYPADNYLIKNAEKNYNKRNYEAAEKSYRQYWLQNFENKHNTKNRNNKEMLPSALLLDIRNAVIKTNQADYWINSLSQWKGLEASGFGGSFFLASCFENSGDNEKALYWYERSIKKSEDWQEIRRSQWYIIRLLSRKFPDRLSSYLIETGPLRNDGAYFDDIMDEYYSTLVRYRRWDDLLQLMPAVVNSGLDEAAFQGYFLLQKAVEAGFISSDTTLSLPDSYIPDPRGYYALRRTAENWPNLNSDSGFVPSRLNTVEDECYSYLLSAGYIKEALARLDKNREDISVDTIADFCDFLETEGDLYELIRFAGYWFYRLPPQEGMILLPWVFPGSERYSFSEDRIPEELILGVIRRESAFHEGISSHAGAGGLMQLMPATAAELARKYRMDEWDLFNPVDNIALGTLYLNWLLERPWTETYVEVLAAYNGGGGNLRVWKRQFPFSDPDLFIQSIPFRETRDYVRKVIVAAASYRYLETGQAPGLWLDQFYQPF